MAALLWSRHEHWPRAKVWFEGADDEQFFFCRFTQLTVLRLLTTERIMGKDAVSMSRAWSLWDEVWSDDRVAYLPEPAGLEQELRWRTRLSSRSPKMWADAYLLAFASVTGLKFVTFDQALRTRGLDVLVL